MNLVFIKRLVRTELFSCRQHIINMKWLFFTLDSKNMVVQEFFHDGYERSNLYIWRKNQNKKKSKIKVVWIVSINVYTQAAKII